MTKQEIIENNNLIAKFMGLSYREEKFYEGWYKPKGNDIYYLRIASNHTLQYHSSWNWLMPVVNKIESLSYRKGRYFYLHKESSYVQFRIDRMNVSLFSKWGTTGNSDILIPIYKAIIEFINFYNKMEIL